MFNSKSSNTFERPLFHSNNATLVDIVSENLYYNSKEIKGNLVNTVSNAYRHVSDFYKNDKNALPFTIGTLSSIVINGLVTQYAADHEYSSSIVKFVSYCGESAANTVATIVVYGLDAYRRGKETDTVLKEFGNTTKELGKLVLITAPLSILPYRFIRNLSSDLLVGLGMSSAIAMPIIQTTLLYPFVRSIKYTQDAVKYVSNNIAYFRANPGSFKESVRNRKELAVLKLSYIGDTVKDTSGLVFELAREKSTTFIENVKNRMRA
jgi:hypothetical protein